jgi:hypothetical protein
MNHTKILDGKCRENVIYIGSPNSQALLRKRQCSMNFLLAIESPELVAVTVMITVVIALLQRGHHV